MRLLCCQIEATSSLDFSSHSVDLAYTFPDLLETCMLNKHMTNFLVNSTSLMDSLIQFISPDVLDHTEPHNDT